MRGQASIGAKIYLDRRDFRAAAAATEKDAINLARGIEKAGSSSGGFIGKWTEMNSKFNVITQGLQSVRNGLTSVFDASAKKEGLLRSLAAVTDGSEEWADQVDALAAAARLPGLGDTEILEASTALQGAGFAAKEARDTVIQFGNALAISNKGKNELNEVIAALARIKSSGKVTENEMEVLANRMFQIRSISKEIGGPSIGADAWIKGATEGLSKLPRAADGARDSLDNLGDAWSRLLANIGNINVSIPVYGKENKKLTLLDDVSNTINTIAGLTEGKLPERNKGDARGSAQVMLDDAWNWAAKKIAEGNKQMELAPLIPGKSVEESIAIHREQVAEKEKIDKAAREKKEREERAANAPGAKFVPSAAEIADRQAAAAKAKADAEQRVLDNANKILQKAEDELELERNIARAKADGATALTAELEDQLAILKNAEEVAKQLGVDQKIVEESIIRQNAFRREAEAAAKPKDTKNEKGSVLEQLEIDKARGRGNERKAKKLERERTEKSRTAELETAGFSADEAKRIAKEEGNAQIDQEFFAKTGKRKIRSTGKPTIDPKSGFHSKSFDFAGYQDAGMAQFASLEGEHSQPTPNRYGRGSAQTLNRIHAEEKAARDAKRAPAPAQAAATDSSRETNTLLREIKTAILNNSPSVAEKTASRS